MSNPGLSVCDPQEQCLGDAPTCVSQAELSLFPSRPHIRLETGVLPAQSPSSNLGDFLAPSPLACASNLSPS